MAELMCQVRLPHVSALPQDVYVNTFVFTGIDDTGDMATAIYGRLVNFYNATQSSGQKLLNYLSTVVQSTGARLQIYDLDQPEPRVPIFDESMSLPDIAPSGSASNLPSEVAVCLSYRGDLVSGTNPARRRGRIYLGPLNSNCLDGASASDTIPRPSSTFRTTLAQAGTALAAANTLGASWRVWSRAGGSFTEITAGWVDNSFDTQRRRGERSTTRINWAPE